MELKDSITAMRDLMGAMCQDLKKAEKGNKTASQRVRTASVKFAKIAKFFRKESMPLNLKKSKKPKKKR